MEQLDRDRAGQLTHDLHRGIGGKVVHNNKSVYPLVMVK